MQRQRSKKPWWSMAWEHREVKDSLHGRVRADIVFRSGGGAVAYWGVYSSPKKIFRGFYATGTIAHRVEGQIESQGIGSLLLEGEIAFASWKT